MKPQFCCCLWILSLFNAYALQCEWQVHIIYYEVQMKCFLLLCCILRHCLTDYHLKLNSRFLARTPELFTRIEAGVRVARTLEAFSSLETICCEVDGSDVLAS